MYYPFAATNIVGVAIFNLEVEDFDGFGEVDNFNTFDWGSVPVLVIYKVAGLELFGLDPALILDLKGVGVGTADHFAANLQLYQLVYLVDGGGNNALNSRFTCDVVNASLLIL